MFSMTLLILVGLFGVALGAILATLYHKGIVDDSVKLATEYQLALALAKSDLRVAEARLKALVSPIEHATPS